MNRSTNIPPELTLHPKRLSAVGLFLICSMFVAGGIWMGIVENSIGYLIAAFFGLGIPVAAIQLIPGSTYLHLDASGFTICNLFRKTRVPWSVVAEFFVVTLSQTGMKVHSMVGFDFVPSYDRARLGRRIATAIGKCEGALPDTYGKDAEELAELMNTCLRLSKSTEENAE